MMASSLSIFLSCGNGKEKDVALWIVHSFFRRPVVYDDPTVFSHSYQVLESLRDAYPHSLHAVDITDDDKRDWFSKYK
jgi:hypothetical protein